MGQWIILLEIQLILLIFAVHNAVGQNQCSGGGVPFDDNLLVNIPRQVAEIPKRIAPAIVDGDMVFHVCKGKMYDGTWNAGKLIDDNGTPVCLMDKDYRTEYKSREYMLLEASPGALGWVPYNFNFPKRPISVGPRHGDGREAFVCRGFYEGKFFVGATFMNDANCIGLHYDRSKKPYVLMVNFGYEILAETAYGLALRKAGRAG